MGPLIIKKLFSAVLTCVFVFGVMVVIVDEGPMEMPYYDGQWNEPITSPQLSTVSYSIDISEPRISSLPQGYVADPASVNDQKFNSTISVGSE